MSHCSWNINQILQSRELLPIRKKFEIENTLEDCFAQGNYTFADVPLPPNVSSTIAIAVSCDGLTFATTHGDHTVKVFQSYVNTPYRVFNGHPRTPWTVKYHPSDPNILASGCLGFQIRVWDIENNTCLNINRLEYSIISLSFHPNGEYIAVATGIKLEVWNWKRGLRQTNNYADQHIVQHHQVEHTRNIRAVLFYPSGDYLLAAAPDAPRPAGETLTYCK
jgi:WD40 repeat protein